MPKRYDNTIRKLFFRSKRTTKATLSSITIIGLIIYIEDPKETFSVDYVHIKEDTEIEETTIADITTTTHPVGSNTISVINLDASQASI